MDPSSEQQKLDREFLPKDVWILENDANSLCDKTVSLPTGSSSISVRDLINALVVCINPKCAPDGIATELWSHKHKWVTEVDEFGNIIEAGWSSGKVLFKLEYNEIELLKKQYPQFDLPISETKFHELFDEILYSENYLVWRFNWLPHPVGEGETALFPFLYQRRARTCEELIDAFNVNWKAGELVVRDPNTRKITPFGNYYDSRFHSARASLAPFDMVAHALLAVGHLSVPIYYANQFAKKYGIEISTRTVLTGSTATRPLDWPDDMPGAVFLARAVQSLGQAHFGPEWTGGEPAAHFANAPPILPSGGISTGPEHQRYASDLLQADDLRTTGRFTTFEGRLRGENGETLSAPAFTAVEWQRAIQLSRDALESHDKAVIRFLVVARVLMDAGQHGAQFLTRGLKGGTLTPLPSEAWFSEPDNLIGHFENCQVDPQSPFEPKDPQWIYIEKTALEGLIQPSLQVRPTEAVGAPIVLTQQPVVGSFCEGPSGGGDSILGRGGPKIKATLQAMHDLGWGTVAPDGIGNKVATDIINAKLKETHPSMSITVKTYRRAIGKS